MYKYTIDRLSQKTKTGADTPRSVCLKNKAKGYHNQKYAPSGLIRTGPYDMCEPCLHRQAAKNETHGLDYHTTRVR